MRSDPEKARQWQQRSARRYREKRHAQGVDNAVGNVRQIKSYRNDAAWANEVKVLRGWRCRACGDRRHVQVDHVWPRSQGGPSVFENGLPLCGEFSRVTPGGCHPKKTAGAMLIRFEWLDADQVAWLAQVGWVAWDEHGQPYGRGWKHFGAKGGANG